MSSGSSVSNLCRHSNHLLAADDTAVLGSWPVSLAPTHAKPELVLPHKAMGWNGRQGRIGSDCWGHRCSISLSWAHFLPGWDSKLPKDSCLCTYVHMPRTACTSPGYPRLDWEMLPQCHTSKLGGNRAARMNRRPELICRTSAAMLLVKSDPSHILQSGIIPPPTCADTSTLARKHKHSHKQSKRKIHSQRRKLAF